MDINLNTSAGNGSDANFTAPSVADDNNFEDVIVVAVWSVMLTYALVANGLVIVGVLRNDAMRKATSYWFIVSLATCDMLMVTISLGHIVPATYWHERYLTVYSKRNIVVLFFYDLFWYTGVLKLGVMALNRFTSIVYPMDYKLIFTPRRTLTILSLLYTCGLLVSIPTLLPCCHTLYDHNMWVTIYDPMDTWYTFVDLVQFLDPVE